MVMGGGFYIFELMDSTATLVSCYVILFMECIVISHYFGYQHLNETCANKTGFTIPYYVFVSLKVISPVVLIIFAAFSISSRVIII